MKNNLDSEQGKVKIDLSLIQIIRTNQIEESQTIIHCIYESPYKFQNGGWVNINTSTFLINNTSKLKLKLIQAVNIPVAPARHSFNKPGERIRFTLIFEGLPKSWIRFDLCESSFLEDGFHVKDIKKNRTGVYEINLK